MCVCGVCVCGVCVCVVCVYVWCVCVVCVCVCVCVYSVHNTMPKHAAHLKHAPPDTAKKLSARSERLCFATECRLMDWQINPLNVKHKPRLD